MNEIFKFKLNLISSNDYLIIIMNKILKQNFDSQLYFKSLWQIPVPNYILKTKRFF